MRVDQVMSSPAVTVTADTPIKEAAALLAARGFTALPVLDGNRELVGIVSEGDVVADRIPRHPRAGSAAVAPLPPAMVGGVMTTKVEMTSPDEDVRMLIRRMRAARVRSVPVVDRGTLLGVVTLHDLVEVLAREDGRIAADIRRTLAGYADGRYQVRVRDGVAVLVDQGDSPEEWPTVRSLVEQVPGVQHARVTGVTVDATGTPGPESIGLQPVGPPGPADAPADPTGSWTPATRWWAV